MGPMHMGRGADSWTKALRTLSPRPSLWVPPFPICQENNDKVLRLNKRCNGMREDQDEAATSSEGAEKAHHERQ